MTRWLIMAGLVAGLAGCGLPRPGWLPGGAARAPAPTPAPIGVTAPEVSEDPGLRPRARPGIVAAPAPGDALGQTVASLGAPSDPGFWLKTPLVADQRPGVIRAGGTSVDVTLRPLEAAPGAGSRLSLAAMQALGVPLTDLVELSVTAR